MKTYLDVSGSIWMTLSGFDRIWAYFVGSGRRFVWISNFEWGFIGFSWLQKDLAGLQKDLVGFNNIQVHFVGLSCSQLDNEFPYVQYVWYGMYGMVWYGMHKGIKPQFGRTWNVGAPP